MLNIFEIRTDYDEMEKIVQRYSFEELFERYNGYNLCENQFDIELEDYIFTIRKRKWGTYLSSKFQIFYNNEWLDFERW